MDLNQRRGTRAGPPRPSLRARPAAPGPALAGYVRARIPRPDSGEDRAAVISIIDPMNTASIRVAEKIGMRYESDDVFHGLPVGIYAVRRGA